MLLSTDKCLTCFFTWNDSFLEYVICYMLYVNYNLVMWRGMLDSTGKIKKIFNQPEIKTSLQTNNVIKVTFFSAFKHLLLCDNLECALMLVSLLVHLNIDFLVSNMKRHCKKVKLHHVEIPLSEKVFFNKASSFSKSKKTLGGLGYTAAQLLFFFTERKKNPKEVRMSE